MNPRLRRAATASILIGAAGTALYLGALQPRAVVAHTVERGEVLAEVLGTGSIESRRTVDLGFEVTGRVARLAVDQGDPVTAAQELASLDDETYRVDLALADEELALARAGVARLEAERGRAEAVLAGAEANARRVQSLHEQRLVSAEALEEADERLRIAVADLARANAAHAEAEQRVATTQQALSRAEARLRHTVARSPFDGVVLRRDREVGDVAVPGAPVLRLAATDVVWASVWVDETFLDLLRPGQPARIHLRSAPERPLRGTVARIGREVDRETRELLVDVAIERLPERLALGQRADLWIEVGRAEDAVRLPPELLVRWGDRAGAWVLREGRARFAPLELGAHSRDWVEVRAGLAAGDVVLRPASAGAPPLREGVRVRTLEPPRS